MSYSPRALAWLRGLLVVLALASLRPAATATAFLTPHWASLLIVTVFALPALVPLFFAVVARRRSRPVYTGMLVTTVALLVWTLRYVGMLFTSSHPELPVRLVVAVGVLVLLLLPRTRAYYLAR